MSAVIQILETISNASLKERSIIRQRWYYARENCALGGVSYAIDTGKAFLKGLESSVEDAVNGVCTFLNGRVLARGPVQNFSIETTGGFDVGYAAVDGCEMTFWNEYATA